jgi:hypothetical protein
LIPFADILVCYRKYFTILSGAVLLSFNPAGGGVYGATGCTAFLAEGSFAGLSRKCAWSGCSSAIGLFYSVRESNGVGVGVGIGLSARMLLSIYLLFALQ